MTSSDKITNAFFFAIPKTTLCIGFFSETFVFSLQYLLFAKINVKIQSSIIDTINLIGDLHLF